MIVLASQSAARRAMLTAAGVAHGVQPARVDEEAVTAGLVAAGASPARVADALAEVKAVKVSQGTPRALVLGADSVLVAADGALLTKPETLQAAAVQLQRLAGTTHRLISAAVMAENGAAVWRRAGEAQLTMRGLSNGFIADYLSAEGEAVLGCVGSYRIEGLGAQLFMRIEGDQFVIRGLPLLAVLDYLRVRRVLAS